MLLTDLTTESRVSERVLCRAKSFRFLVYIYVRGQFTWRLLAPTAREEVRRWRGTVSTGRDGHAGNKPIPRNQINWIVR